MQVTKFFLKDVRCFEGRQEFNIRPLTFLVGENSTGKSTVFGCMQALANVVGNSDEAPPYFDFNTNPFKMGSYADIARRVGNKPTTSFDLGFEIQYDSEEPVSQKSMVEDSKESDLSKAIRVSANLMVRKGGFDPVIKRLRIDFGELVLVFHVTQGQNIEEGKLDDFLSNLSVSKTESGKLVYTHQVADEVQLLPVMRHYSFWLMRRLDQETPPAKLVQLSATLEEVAKRFFEGINAKRPRYGRRYGYNRLLPRYHRIRLESFSPVRSKPMRTYDPVRERDDPEGGGMPMTLMNLHHRDKQNWERMRKSLARFGEESGCFTDIQIKRHGESMGDPFQIHIKVRNLTSNIMDVGYGISQILPILVRIIREKGKTFLIQQPEVHLHPQAQAALVGMLLDLNQSNRNLFVVETHSDAMIDRARIEIMNGRVKPEDVSLIYLEPSKKNGNKVDVHNITFDALGNPRNVPRTYRDFFLRESNRLLGLREDHGLED